MLNIAARFVSPMSRTRSLVSLFSLLSSVMVAAGCGSGGNAGSAEGAAAAPAGGESSQGIGGAAVGTGGAAGGPVVACQGSFSEAPLAAAEHVVSVEPATSWGQLPHFWNTYGTGHLGLFSREDRGWGELLRAHVVDGVQNLDLTRVRQHGLFHDDIGIYREVDGLPVYDFTRSDEIFDFLVGAGVQPIVELAPMPRDLAADPTKVVFDWNMIVSPPKDFQLWQQLVFRFVEHSVERYGAAVVAEWYFEVWNEPECCTNKFWAGTLEQYYELYDHAAAGVRAALPNGRVGGPVLSQPIELTQNSALGQTFLEHVTTDNYVTPGSPGVLDFFSYHSWSFIDGAVNGYFQGLDLLDSFGKSDVGIAITEFGPTYEFDLYDEPQENRHGATFVAQVYSNIAQRCVLENKRFPITYSWWVLSDVFEEGLYREEDPFIGGMGLTSRQNIRKPAYNAYKFLAQMGDEQVALTASGSAGVGGMAAKDAQGGVQVLLYNGQSPGLGPKDDTYYTVTAAHSIALTVSGLNPALAYDVTAYRVDEAHGNAYGTWETQGRPSMANMTEADWTALRDTMDSPAEPLGQALCGATFTQSFSLSSPGVLLVTLTPSSP